MLRDKITEIFVKADDFCNLFNNEYSKFKLIEDPILNTRNRATGLCDSEVISILIAFHSGQFRNFKHFYKNYVQLHLLDLFPGLVSYNRFIELSHRHAIALMFFLHH